MRLEFNIDYIRFSNRVYRAIWNIVWLFLFRPSPTLFHFWRVFLLKVFGAQIASGVHVYPSVKIWAPWNLQMDEDSCLSHYVDCYNVAKVTLKRNSIVSQYCFLCTATHDYTKRDFPLLTAPISIGANAWITADVFIAPGVNIGEGAVVNARSCVFSNIEPWVVAKGNPAAAYKVRVVDNYL